MYRLINEATAQSYPQTMDQHFRLRHSIFVKENQWTEFDVDGVREKDNYDTDESIYAIAIGPREDVMGGFRLYPSTLPHMISETFAHLIEGAIISRPDVMEISRFHLAPDYRNSKPHYLEAFAAMQEIGLELGLSAYTCVTRTLRIPMFQVAGVVADPLGMPALVDGVSTSAILMHVTEESLAAINKNRGSSETVLEHHQFRRRRA